LQALSSEQEPAWIPPEVVFVEAVARPVADFPVVEADCSAAPQADDFPAEMVGCWVELWADGSPVDLAGCSVGPQVAGFPADYSAPLLADGSPAERVDSAAPQVAYFRAETADCLVVLPADDSPVDLADCSAAPQVAYFRAEMDDCSAALPADGSPADLVDYSAALQVDGSPVESAGCSVGLLARDSQVDWAEAGCWELHPDAHSEQADCRDDLPVDFPGCPGRAGQDARHC
jgi:hypothetical protein